MAIQYFETIEVKLAEVADLCCYHCKTDEKDIDLLCFCVECKQYFCAPCLTNHEKENKNWTGNGFKKHVRYPRTNVSQSFQTLCTGNQSCPDSKVYSISLPNLSAQKGASRGQLSWSRRLDHLKVPTHAERETWGRKEDQSRPGKLSQTSASVADVADDSNNRKERSDQSGSINMSTYTDDVHDFRHQSMKQPAGAEDRCVDKNLRSSDHEELLVLIKMLKTEMEHTKKMKQENISRLSRERVALVNEMQTFLNSIQQLVHEVQTETLCKLNKVHREFEYQARKDVSKLEKLIVSLTKCQQELLTTITSDKTEVTDYMSKVKSCEKEKDTINYSFTDVFEKKDNMQSAIEEGVEDFIYRMNKIGNHFLESSPSKDLPAVFDLKLEDDQTVCDMNGACQIDDGAVIVADYNNCRLKRIDERFQVTSTCGLMSMPWAVCPVRPSEVAVSMYLLKKVQLVDIEVMRTTTSFRVQETCRGLTFSNGELFVGCGGGGLGEGPGHIRVYTPSGQPIRTIEGGANESSMFSCPFHIAASTDSSIYVADRDNGLIQVGKVEQGSICAKLQSSHLKGVCVDADGNVYVSETKTGCIIKIDTEEKQEIMLKASEGVHRPQSVTLVQNDNKLLVTLSNSNSVKVVDLTRMKGIVQISHL